MKIIALDVHRTFAQVAILENGKIRDAGRLELEREHILKFAERLNVVNGGRSSCQWGGAKVGHLVVRLGA